MCTRPILMPDSGELKISKIIKLLNNRKLLHPSIVKARHRQTPTRP